MKITDMRCCSVVRVAIPEPLLPDDNETEVRSLAHALKLSADRKRC